MAATDVSVQESWTVEPELTESPPRRLAPSGYPDLNKPNEILFQGIGAVLIIAGIGLLIYGASRNVFLWTLIGITVTLLGMFIAVLLIPAMKNRHLARVKRLVESGAPVMARVLSADNMGGDNTYKRLVKYQVTNPSGELTHHTTQADDRLLPRKIPGNTTALLDLQTGDVELYCALPYRAVPRPANVARPVTSTVGQRPVVSSLPGSVVGTPATETAPPANVGSMGTINIGSLPQRPAPTPEPVPPAPPVARQEPSEEEKKERPSPPVSLPWE